MEYSISARCTMTEAGRGAGDSALFCSDTPYSRGAAAAAAIVRLVHSPAVSAVSALTGGECSAVIVR